ncbi:MAG: squalene/phytoene synthase family protein, partial [Planctomycetes bacterium]|nr:squalene/phytoene synthase family protein [Planctomycetota bacterium]
MAQPGVASRQPGAMPLAAALKGTSRSFYRSLRFLPAATRTQVARAYLLARAADTMADSPAAPVAVRQAGLEALRSALERGHAPAAVDPALRAAAPPGPARALLDGLPELFAALAELAPEERALVRGVLATLTGGMLDDLRQFPDPATVTALASAADRAAYTYAVAGCVGEFWTRLHARALPALAGAPV